MNKYLVLINSLYDQYEPLNKDINYTFMRMLKSSSQNRLFRFIRTIHLQSHLPFKSIWYDDWKYRIKDYDTIITADTGNTFAIIKDIKKHNPNIRIINWYRNPVKNAAKIIDRYNEYCEVWSFDKNDCRKYGLKFNPQFCMKRGDYREQATTIDAYFIGGDKGRLAILLDLEKQMKTLGIKAIFNIVGYNSQRISYKEVINNISSSKAIIDIQCYDQQGFTLRPMESLLYDKKLITNNIDVAKEEFYNHNNIFILGKDSIECLPEFLVKPYILQSNETKNKYFINGWLSRFENGESSCI